MKLTFLFFLLFSIHSNAQEGFNSWKEYGLKGKIKTMKINFTNYQQPEIYSHQEYYFAENGVLDSIFYAATGGYEQTEITQIFYHHQTKNDSAKILDKNRNILNKIDFQWNNDKQYTETNYNFVDSTLLKSEITLSQNFRDWKRENKMYKNESLIVWEKYENTISVDDLILSSVIHDFLVGTVENKCTEYIAYDHLGNPTDMKIYLICDNKEYWIRYQKEYEYYK